MTTKTAEAGILQKSVSVLELLIAVITVVAVVGGGFVSHAIADALRDKRITDVEQKMERYTTAVDAATKGIADANSQLRLLLPRYR